MKVHIIAIGGAVMHNLAIDLQSKGYQVTGSDDEIYEPSKSRLKEKNLLPKKFGWFPESITEELDMIILGMHAKKENPELIKALQLGLKIKSYPEFVFLESRNKKRIVVAGSHGKTTTTSMIMHVLKDNQIEFDYLVGANLEGFTKMVQISDNELIVLEGDEYLSSALDKRAKMLHYHPDLLIITGIAWDHINVFPTEEDYINQFRILLENLDNNAKIFYAKSDPKLVELIANSSIKESAIPYGSYHSEQKIEFLIFGSHNFENMQAAYHICDELGITAAEFEHSMVNFKGASNRLQLIYADADFCAYSDFAHAPSKVKATTNAMKDRFADKNLVVFFELHTFSSLNKNFIPQYKLSLEAAECVYIYYNPEVLHHKGIPVLDKNYLVEQFAHKNVQIITSKKTLTVTLNREIAHGNALLFMSSGTFGGVSIKSIILEKKNNI